VMTMKHNAIFRPMSIVIPVLLGVALGLVSVQDNLYIRALVVFIFLLSVIGWVFMHNSKLFAYVFVILVPVLPEVSIRNAQVQLGDILFLVAIPLLLMRTIERQNVARFSVLRWLLLYTGVLLVSLFLNSMQLNALTFLVSFAKWVRLLEIIVIIFLVFRLKIGNDDDDVVIRGLTIAGLVGAVAAIVIFIMQLPNSSPETIIIGNRVFQRAAGFVGESNAAANYFGIICLITLAYLLHKRVDTIKNSVRLVTLLASGVALILTFSRGSLLGTVAGAIIIGFISRHGNLKRLGVYLLSFLGLFLCLWLADPQILSALTSKFQLAFNENMNVASSHRLGEWQWALNWLGENPIYLFFGTGYKLMNTQQWYSTYGVSVLDNSYISALFETGIIGLASTVILLLSLFRLSVRGLKYDSRTRVLSTALLGCLVMQCINMITVDAMTFWRSILVIFVLAAIITVRLNANGKSVH
jgi:hypothetical protein